jgi:hypothetical protein
MRLIISFDTEDFTDPASNDALLRICQTLTMRGVQASFGLVGEKARFIRDQGRLDVIEALRRHCICYHSDNHFLFPDKTHQPQFASEIVEECDWDEAVRWLIATEARGLTDTEGLFGLRPITYLRTCGDSAPQIQEAYRQLGLKVFAYGPSLYEQWRHIAHYANMLCVSLPLVSEEFTYRGEGPAKLDALAAAGEDLINVRFHPCRFISDEWWDVVNYLNIPDPPTRPPYEIAPRVSSEETDQRIRRLGELVDYARETYGAQFTTYDALWHHTPRSPALLSRTQVLEVAKLVRQRMSCMQVDWVTLNLAEAFGAIIWASLNPGAEQIPLRPLVGPAAAPGAGAVPVGRGAHLTANEIVRACREAEEVIESKGRVAHEVTLGSVLAPPGVLLKAAAAHLLREPAIALEPAALYPEGFDDVLRRWDEASFDMVAFFPNRNRPAPNTKMAIKLQYWTYKLGE